MMKKLFYFSAIFFSISLANAQYATPNTGVNWSTAELIANSGGTITFSGAFYTITQNLTISAADQITVSQNAIIKVNPGVQITVEGTLIVDAPAVTITATNQTARYESIRFESGSTGYFNNITINYGKGILVATGDFQMHNSSMSYHIGGTATSAALTFSTGSPLVSNSSFTSNVVPAFSSGANQEVAATFSNNYLENNNTSNTNRPQINMGPSGNDTIRIINNIIKGNPANTLVGGISASSLLGNPNRVIIDGNTVFDNRYGITVIGGTSGGFIRNNVIEDNDTQNLPAVGGSGISLSAANAGMNIIASGNQIRRNLWGITLINQAGINLGTADPNDNSPGGNIFADNGNGGNDYALFNNTPLAVNAANNCWIEGSTPSAADVENVISHQNDDPNLGPVMYTPFSCSLSLSEQNLVKPEIYPNPSNGHFSIKAPSNGTATIYNLNGQLLWSQTLVAGDNPVEVNIPAGMYILTNQTDTKTFTEKLMLR